MFISIIFAIKLSKYFRRMKAPEDDNKKEDEEAEDDGNDGVSPFKSGGRSTYQDDGFDL